MAESKVWALDRATGKVGQYTVGFLDAWPNGYLRVDPPKSKKQAARSVSSIPDEGTNTEGGA